MLDARSMLEYLMLGDTRARKCPQIGARTRLMLGKSMLDPTLKWRYFYHSSRECMTRKMRRKRERDGTRARVASFVTENSTIPVCISMSYNRRTYHSSTPLLYIIPFPFYVTWGLMKLQNVHRH